MKTLQVQMISVIPTGSEHFFSSFCRSTVITDAVVVLKYSQFDLLFWGGDDFSSSSGLIYLQVFSAWEEAAHEASVSVSGRNLEDVLSSLVFSALIRHHWNLMEMNELLSLNASAETADPSQSSSPPPHWVGHMKTDRSSWCLFSLCFLSGSTDAASLPLWSTSFSKWLFPHLHFTTLNSFLVYWHTHSVNPEGERFDSTAALCCQ